MTVTVEAANTRPEGALSTARAVVKGTLGAADAPFAGALDAQGFSGEVGDTAVLTQSDGSVEILVGFGTAGELDEERCRRAGAVAARAASHLSTAGFDCSALTETALDAVEVATAITEGALLASYRFFGHRQAIEPVRLDHFVLFGADLDALRRGVQRGAARAEAVSCARDLVNMPARDLTPTRFAELAVERGEMRGFSVEVHDERAVAEMGLGGLLGVAKGSAEPPRLVRAEYVPKSGSQATVALVGKGITFDSGGLSIKTLTGMMTMKYDVAGASTVIGTIGACASLNIPVRVVGFMPLTENMPGGSATRPGDVLTTRNRKTIEVLSTDAEGRLVLADALALAAEERPDAMVDVATLTAPIVVALGRKIAGLMSNDDRLAAALEAAAWRAGEGMWRMPLPSGYRSLVDSEVADMKNIGQIGIGGAIMAGLILEEFVGSVPWAHLDIAGVGWSEENDGYLRKGGTGFGVRTLLELLDRYEPLGGKAQDNPTGRRVVR